MITLTARDKKLLVFSEYSDHLSVASLGGRWSSKYRAFSFPPSVATFNRIVEELESCGAEYTVDERVAEHYKNKSAAIDIEDCDFVQKTESLPHQVKVTEFLLSVKRGFDLSDPGVGKSKCVIDAAAELMRRKLVRKCLVICPAGIMDNFSDEIKKHSDYDSTVVSGPRSKRLYLLNNSEADFFIINYEYLDELSVELIMKDFDMVILDEVHMCKTHTATRSKAAHKICQEAQYVIGLTGTFVSNNYMDVFMPFKIVDSSVFGEYITAFKRRYVVYGGFMNKNIIRYQNEEELKSLIASRSIRYALRDVVELPPEFEIIKEFTPSEDLSATYKSLFRDLFMDVGEEKVSAQNVLEKILKLSQLTSGFVSLESGLVDVDSGKLNLLRETIAGISGKVCVFARFTHSIDRIAELCRNMGISYVIFDGRTKGGAAYKSFNEDDTKVFIAQIQKGIGFSIPACKHSVFYELSYSRAHHTQCKGRTLRAKGSEVGSCVYIYLQAKGTIDEVILKTLKDKDFTSDKALAYVKGSLNDY